MAEFKNITDIWVTKPPFEIDKVYVVIPYEDEDEKTLRSHLGEIIRCRDCKYYRPAGRLGMKLPPDCGYFSVGKYLDTDLLPDDYCSRAERKE
jgi:hypothetical protein